MDEQFEKDLNKKAAESYEIKTSASSILSAYHAKQEAKKTASYKRPFFVAATAFGCATIALAVYIPVSLRLQNNPTTSDPTTSATEIGESPLKDDTATLAYEVTSLYPFLKKSAAPTPSARRQNATWVNTWTNSAFSQAVDAYDEIESPIHEAFALKNENAGVLTGVFAGANGGVFTYKMDLLDVGTFLFNTSSSSSSGHWNTLEGELSGADGLLYTVEGSAREGKKRSDLSLYLYDESKANYCFVQQDSTSGVFFFSYQLFTSSQLAYTLTIRLLSAQDVARFVLAQYYDASISSGGTYRVLPEGEEVYSLYGTGLGKILLSYNNNVRTYKFGTITITKK